MERVIGASEFDNDLEEALRMVSSPGERIVLTRDGKPVAALLSVEDYQKWKRSIRHELVTMIQANAEVVDMSPEEADELVSEAICVTRATQ